jgi:hypothetical protein
MLHENRFARALAEKLGQNSVVSEFGVASDLHGLRRSSPAHHASELLVTRTSSLPTT